MKKNPLLIVFCTGMACFGSTLFASAIVQNGSFETGDFTGWTKSGYLTVTTSRNGMTAEEGVKYVAPIDTAPPEEYITQTISLNSGMSYNLTFYTAAALTTGNSIKASMGGLLLGTVNSFLPGGQWSLNSFSFTATNSSELLSLNWTNVNLSGPASLDNVSVTAVPEPSTYVLFGLGALALVVAYRRRNACKTTAGPAKVA